MILSFGLGWLIGTVVEFLYSLIKPNWLVASIMLMMISFCVGYVYKKLARLSPLKFLIMFFCGSLVSIITFIYWALNYG